MLEYPKMIYRSGKELVWEGRQLATRIVADAEEEAEAIAGGWRTIETILKAEAAKVVKRARA